MTVRDEARAYGGVGERVAHGTSGGGLLVRRWLGCWIDFVALVLLLFWPGLLGYLLGPPGAVAAAVMVLTAIALVLLYFPITEGIWGRSAGKFVTGTIVVDEWGRPPGIGKAAIRTLARLIEVNPFLLGGLPAGIVSMNTKAHQRIGDLWAGTYVVPFGELRRAQAQPDADIDAVAEHFA
jgi:uncharacterized RDD family membrane protein YckC